MDDAQPTIRVLQAEDDPLARRAVDTYLSRAADIELVGVAVDGEQAVQLAIELRPDVCLVDVHMPKMDGIEVTRIVTAPPLNCRAVCFTALGDDRTLSNNPSKPLGEPFIRRVSLQLDPDALEGEQPWICANSRN